MWRRRTAAAVLPVGEDPGGLPAGHEGGEQAQNQSGAVEQHVEAVRDQAQAVGPNAVEQLHEREGLRKTNNSGCYGDFNSVTIKLKAWR